MYANENKVAYIAHAVDELRAEIGAVKNNLVEMAEVLREVADRGFYADYRNWLAARAALGMELPVISKEFTAHEFNFNNLFPKGTPASKEAFEEANPTKDAIRLAAACYSRILEEHQDWISNPVAIYCGPGWVGLVERAFAEIASIVRPIGQRLTIVQLHERMGTLCLRVITAGLADEVQSKLGALTRAVASQSRSICETCGGQGQMYKLPYRAVRCEKHAAEEARS